MSWRRLAHLTKWAFACGSLLLFVPRPANAAYAELAGGSGYSGDLSHNLAIRHQQLICDPTSGTGSASVTYDPSMTSLYSIYNTAGYDLSFENVGVMVGTTKEVVSAAQFFAAQGTSTPLTPWGYVQVGWTGPSSASPGTEVVGGTPIQATMVAANTVQGSATISGLGSTTAYFTGEGVTGAQFVAGTVITSVGSNSIVVSNTANATTTGTTLTFSGLAFDGTTGPAGSNTFGLEFNYLPTSNFMPVPYMVYAETTGYPVMGGTGTTSPTDYITDASEPNEEITDIKPAMMAGALPEPSMGLLLLPALAVLASGRGLRVKGRSGRDSVRFGV